MRLTRLTHLGSILALILGGCASDVAPPGGGGPSEPSAYLRASHPRLVIEVDAVPGAEPRAGVSDRVVEAIAPLVDKPEGITVTMDDALASRGSDHVWTFAELDALSRERFDADVPEGTAVLHTMWVDGSYEGDDGGGVVLGVAWANRSLAMFRDNIARACDRPLLGERLCFEAESAVWTHEIGHVFGLVNNGIPMVEDHEDPEHPRHAVSEDDVMYWAYEGASAIDLLVARMGDGQTFRFGPASLADAAAFRAAD